MAVQRYTARTTVPIDDETSCRQAELWGVR